MVDCLQVSLKGVVVASVVLILIIIVVVVVAFVLVLSRAYQEAVSQ